MNAATEFASLTKWRETLCQIYQKYAACGSAILRRMEGSMGKSVFVVAALVAAVSTTAVAKDVKQPKYSGPVQMTDSEMDKITAGYSTDNNGLNGGGIGYGNGNGGGNGQGPAHNNFHARFQPLQ
jgi:hypothetical protein